MATASRHRVALHAGSNPRALGESIKNDQSSATVVVWLWARFAGQNIRSIVDLHPQMGSPEDAHHGGSLPDTRTVG